MKTIISIIRIIFLYILIFLVLFALGFIISYQFDTDGYLYQNIPRIYYLLFFLFISIFPAFIIFLGFKYKTNLVKINDISLKEENKIKILGSVPLFFSSLDSGFNIALISIFLFIFLFTVLSKTRIVGILDKFLRAETDHIIVLGGLITFFIAVFILKLPIVECLGCYFCYMMSFFLSFGLKKGNLIILWIIIINLLCLFVLKNHLLDVFFFTICCLFLLIYNNHFEIKPLSDVETEKFMKVQISLFNTYLILFFSVAAKSSLISLIKKLVNKYRGRGGRFGGGGSGGSF